MPPAGAEPSYIRTGEAELAPVWLVGFCVRKPIYCAPKTPQIVQVTPSRWNELVATNTAVNQSIQSTPDNSITRPAHDDANEGDCKDYALTKRSRLIDLGWPPGALLIATADVPSGERHAVLVVVTDKGDLVLDNLRYGIVPWAVLQYRWHSIMQPNNPQFWRRIISWLRVHPGALT
jgi:predicted transglutaminase-like cysteine proteinase